MEPSQDPICRRVRENLAAYADGELDGGDLRRLIETHLAECPECRLHLDQLKETWRLLDDLEPPVVRPDFQRQVLARLDAERRQGFWRRTVLRVGGRGVAAMLAAAVAVLLFAGGVARVMQPGPMPPRAAEVHVVEYLDFLREIELLRRFETIEELRRLGQGLGGGAGRAGVSGYGGTGASGSGGVGLSDAHTAADLLHRAAEAAAAAAGEEGNLLEDHGGEAISATALEGSDG